MAGTVAMDPTLASGRDVSKGQSEERWGIQSVLAVCLPSAQTFINITSQPIEKPTSNMEGLLAPARMCRVGLGVVWFCVHVNIHLHLIVQDLHKLLHGGQVT